MGNLISNDMDASSNAAVAYTRRYVNRRFDNVNMEEDEYANHNVIVAVR